MACGPTFQEPAVHCPQTSEPDGYHNNYWKNLSERARCSRQKNKLITSSGTQRDETMDHNL